MSITNDDIEIILENSHSQFSILCAPTGSGKSTNIPLEFIKQNLTLMSLQPTIPATVEISRYMKTKLGDLNVGFAADSIIKYSNTALKKLVKGKNISNSESITPLVYCTYGHFNNKILSVVGFANKIESLAERNEIDYLFCDIVIFDEVHSGAWELEIIMGAFKYGFEELNLNLPKAILTSATIEPDETPFPTSKFYKIESRN